MQTVVTLLRFTENMQALTVAILLNLAAFRCLDLKTIDGRRESEVETSNGLPRIGRPLLQFLFENFLSSTRTNEEQSAMVQLENYEDLFSSKRSDEKRTVVHQACQPRPVVVSTYTQEKGTQTPNAVPVNRCLGGVRNPENHQCQPSKVVLKCFATVDESGRRDFIGVRSHEACEERCICARKECTNQQLYELICPTGFEVNKSSCKCDSVRGNSIFYRNMGIIEDWDRDIHLHCRQNQHKYNVEDGESFSVNVDFR